MNTECHVSFLLILEIEQSLIQEITNSEHRIYSKYTYLFQLALIHAMYFSFSEHSDYEKWFKVYIQHTPLVIEMVVEI